MSHPQHVSCHLNYSIVTLNKNEITTCKYGVFEILELTKKYLWVFFWVWKTLSKYTSCPKLCFLANLLWLWSS